MTNRYITTATVTLFLSIALVACSSDPTEAEKGSPSAGGMDHGEGSPGTSFGEPGSDASVDRTVAITQLDEPSFDPSSITVMAGETIEFEITNEGADDHEFVLGDGTTQDEHAAEMEEMDMEGMAADEDNARSVGPGATETLIWTFSEPGTVIYGCHVNGHYEAGMVGTITVEG